MPVYDFVCQDCKDKFEAVRSMKNADDPIECPKCQSQNTHRVITASNAKFVERSVSTYRTGTR